MARSKLVGLLFEAWNDVDRVLADLRPEEAVRNPAGGSSFAWTVAHLANQLDAWINVRFQQRVPHELIGQGRFRVGGTGTADDWQAIQAGAHDVREAARTYLQGMSDEDLDVVIPYDGSLLPLRATGLSLRYALLRICAHHYFHIGEIATKRDSLGHDIGNYPGLLEQCV